MKARMASDTVCRETFFVPAVNKGNGKRISVVGFSFDCGDQFPHVSQVRDFAGIEFYPAETLLDCDQKLDISQGIPAFYILGRRLGRDDDGVVIEDIAENRGKALPDISVVHGSPSAETVIRTGSGL